jgi:hypothetical protein
LIGVKVKAFPSEIIIRAGQFCSGKPAVGGFTQDFISSCVADVISREYLIRGLALKICRSLRQYFF